MISKHPLPKCALVLFLVLPLVLLEGGDARAPVWLSHRVGGVPLTAIVSVALFLALVALTAVFSAPPADSRRPS
jgi:hypothetical protein